MTYTLPVYASADRTYLTLRDHPGATPAFLTHDSYPSDPDLYVDLPEGAEGTTYYVERVCLDYELVDGGFDLHLYPTEAACLAVINPDDLDLDVGFEAVEVSVVF